MSRTVVLLGMLWIWFAGAATGQQPAPAEPQLYPGDRVDVSVWRNPELSGNFLVAEDGTLQHPLFSPVRVTGMPISAARQRIQEFLSRYEAEPRFIFVPQFRVYVGGHVREQNQFHLPDITVGQAIIRAGGSTAPNRRYRVRLIRGGEPRLANLDGTAESAALLQEEIRSGDQILVEDRPTFVRNYLDPTIRFVQTFTGLVATYVYLNAIFGSSK